MIGLSRIFSSFRSRKKGAEQHRNCSVPLAYPHVKWFFASSRREAGRLRRLPVEIAASLGFLCIVQLPLVSLLIVICARLIHSFRASARFPLSFLHFSAAVVTVSLGSFDISGVLLSSKCPLHRSTGEVQICDPGQHLPSASARLRR